MAWPSSCPRLATRCIASLKLHFLIRIALWFFLPVCSFCMSSVTSGMCAGCVYMNHFPSYERACTCHEGLQHRYIPLRACPASLACMHSLASVSSLACRGRVSLHASLVECCRNHCVKFTRVDALAPHESLALAVLPGSSVPSTGSVPMCCSG
jgi:hypothetical protein